MKEQRTSIDNMILIVDWEAKKKVIKGITKGTYYKTYYDFDNVFAGWRTKEDILRDYPNKVLTPTP